MRDECQHGNLRRQCDHCDTLAELAELREKYTALLEASKMPLIVSGEPVDLPDGYTMAKRLP